MSALASFAVALAQEWPSARLPLTRPAESVGDAVARAAQVCDEYVQACGCEADLREQRAYSDYIKAFAELLNAEPGQRAGIIEKGLVVGGIAAAGLLVAEGVAHGADIVDHADAIHAGADVADVATGGVDILEGIGTLGLSLLASAAVAWFFKRRGDGKRARLGRLIEGVALKARLGRSLLDMSHLPVTARTLGQLKAVESSSGTGE
jgi:hypothetical protein